MTWQGWRLVGWAALAAVLVAALAVGLDGLGAGLRWTARLSGSLFLAAFSASSLYALWPGPATRWLLTNRRYVGVSFAAAHAVHAALVVALTRRPDFEPEPLSLALGGLAYLLIAAMVATSFDRSAAWLGARRWKLLHTTGGWVIWSVLLFTWMGSASIHPLSGVFAGLALGALGVRVIAVRARRRRAA